MDATLGELTNVVLKFRDDREWKQFHNPKDMAISLSIEAAEVLELMQWKNGAELNEHVAKHREELGDELSDVLHAVLLLAADNDIDLAAAFMRKMEKNVAKYPVHKAKGRSTKYTQL